MSATPTPTATALRCVCPFPRQTCPHCPHPCKACDAATARSPFATALQGLVEAAKAVTTCIHQQIGPCDDCTDRLGTALAAWESRGPIADDPEVRAAFDAAIHTHTNWYAEPKWVRAVLTGLDRALTGERGA